MREENHYIIQFTLVSHWSVQTSIIIGLSSVLQSTVHKMQDLAQEYSACAKSTWLVVSVDGSVVNTT